MAFKSRLSSNVLEMKFMKKSKEKCEREAEEEKRKILFDSELPEVFIKGGDMCVMEPSFVPCLQLLNGRFSFKGMNPEIERLMQENEVKDLEKLKKMGGISAQEMAERYSTLMDTMKKRFTPKRKRAAETSSENDDVVVCSPPKSVKKQTNHSSSLKFKKPKDSFVAT